jgi:hypothetical protein
MLAARCGGTFAIVPSMSLSSTCCTPSPETSRVIEGLSDLREIPKYLPGRYPAFAANAALTARNFHALFQGTVHWRPVGEIGLSPNLPLGHAAGLRIEVDGRRNLPSNAITASGEWVNDRTHGQQFRARFLRTSPPTSADGIEKYLSSGMMRGIGPAYAKRLLRAFGEKVFDIIEATPDRLRD